MLFLRIFIGLYGVLTTLAIIEEIMSQGFKTYHLGYLVLSLCLIIPAILQQPDWLLYIGLIGLILYAIYMGLTLGIFQLVHIVIRIIITIIIIYLWNRLKGQ